MRFNPANFRIDIDSLSERFSANARTIFLTSVVMFLVTTAACLVVFFLTLKSSEQVMVPDITGKELSVAMLEMQAKELYPRIQLRYSDNSGDKGFILEQSPSAGSIVKAGRRINLVVSRGIIVDRVENLVGQNINDLRMHLQTLFTGMTNPLIVIHEPLMYRFSTEPAGTILEQNPPPDTPITGQVRVELVVSRGPENDRVQVPDLTGKTIAQSLAELSKTPVIFDFSARDPEGAEQAGTVVSQMPTGGSTVNAGSRIAAVVAMPVKSSNNLVYGIFSETLPLYPYPFQIKIDTVLTNGERRELVSMKHPGGLLTVPYALPEGTSLVLTILNREVGTYEIKAPDKADEAQE